MNLRELIKALLLLRTPRLVAQTTFADLLASFPAAQQAPGTMALVTDLGPGMWFFVSPDHSWRPFAQGPIWSAASLKGYINLGGGGASAATYSQVGNIVTVPWTAHGLTAAFNGDEVYLTQNTGGLVSGWHTNFEYVDPNTFRCTSSASQTTSGNLGTSTGELTINWNALLLLGLPMPTDAFTLTYYHEAKPSANSKAVRAYLAGQIITAAGGSTLTTGGVFTQVNPGGQVFETTTTFKTPGVSTVAQSAGNLTYTITSQLSNAADWHRVIPAVLIMSPRYNPEV